MTDPTSRCRTCGNDLPLDRFYWQDKAHTLRSTECKLCVLARRRRNDELRAVPKPVEVAEILSGITAVCGRCADEHPIEQYRMRPSTGRRSSICDTCRRTQAKEYYRSGPAKNGRHCRYDRGEGFRQCRICGQTKCLDQFRVRDATKGSRRNECIACFREMGRDRYAADPAKHRDVMRRSQFGLKPGQYDEMVLAQTGVCALCGEPERSVNRFNRAPRQLFVDHDHVTGAVRELLCQHCNFGLGQFRDNPELMERAASYIRRHRDR